jgi:hypothetical protein
MIIREQELREIVESSVPLLHWNRMSVNEHGASLSGGTYRIIEHPYGTFEVYDSEPSLSLIGKRESLSAACAIAQVHHRKKIAGQLDIEKMTEYLKVVNQP